MSVVHLLDVNVLVALFDADHVHHEVAHDWFADHRERGWATSPSTENAFVRVVSNPVYGSGLRAVEAADRLRTFCASGHHRFWPDTVSLLDDTVFQLDRLRGHRQLTDVYLLGLAVRMEGRLATFDRAIPIDVVRHAARESIAVVGPAEA